VTGNGSHAVDPQADLGVVQRLPERPQAEGAGCVTTVEGRDTRGEAEALLDDGEKSSGSSLIGR
jgi:hypothetical protein